MTLGHLTGGLVIVEGTCGAGKTTLLRSVDGLFPDWRTQVFTQRQTYAPIVPYEDTESLTDSLNVEILCGMVAEIRAQAARPGTLVFADTLMLTHYVRAKALRLESLMALDRALADLRPLVVLVRVGVATLLSRTVEARRGTGFARYREKFGV